MDKNISKEEVKLIFKKFSTRKFLTLYYVLFAALVLFTDFFYYFWISNSVVIMVLYLASIIVRAALHITFIVLAFKKNKTGVGVYNSIFAAIFLFSTFLYMSRSLNANRVFFEVYRVFTNFYFLNGLFIGMFIISFFMFKNKYAQNSKYSSDYYKKIESIKDEYNKKIFELNVEKALLLNDNQELEKLLFVDNYVSSEIINDNNTTAIINADGNQLTNITEGPLADATGTTDGKSRFVSSNISFFLHKLLWGFLTVITLSLATPYVICMKESYLSQRTITSGYKNTFDGHGHQLIGRYILWVLLSIITFGIYALTIPKKLIAWRTKHTHFDSLDVKESKYTGSTIVKFFLGLGLTILTGITLGLMYPFKIAKMNSYDKSHSIIDGYTLKFEGTAMGYFGTFIKCLLLTIITFGIYYIFVPLQKEKWIRKNTVINYEIPQIVTVDKTEVQKVEENNEPLIENQNEDNVAIAQPEVIEPTEEIKVIQPVDQIENEESNGQMALETNEIEKPTEVEEATKEEEKSVDNQQEEIEKLKAELAALQKQAEAKAPEVVEPKVVEVEPKAIEIDDLDSMYEFVKNEFKNFNNLRFELNGSFERVYSDNKLLSKLYKDEKYKNVKVFFALNPTDYSSTNIKIRDVSETKGHSATPLMFTFRGATDKDKLDILINDSLNK